MKKMLMLATTAAMIEQFNKNNILILEEMGYEVHVAGNFQKGNPISDEKLAEFKLWIAEHGGKWFDIPSTRKPYDLKNNLAAYKTVVALIREHQYTFIHCHTPIGAVIGRLAGHATKTKVIYTAHGFHFYKGAPLINWLLYYPVERWLARYTDVLITINKEDYQRAQKFKAKKAYQIPGVGIDCTRFYNVRSDYRKYRQEFGVSENDFVIVSVGEITKRKNHSVIIRAISCLPEKNNMRYIICGRGPELENNIALVKELRLNHIVQFVGYQQNVEFFYGMADIFAFPSKREGLGLAAIEAMASGLPIITSNAGGIKEYSQNGVTGYMLNADDYKGFADAIHRLYVDASTRNKIGEYNKLIAKRYDIKTPDLKMRQIYKDAEHS